MIYYKALKLKNGELMACSTEQDITTKDALLAGLITVNNPVVFNSFKYLDQDGELVETISMMPMLPIGESQQVQLSADHIFSITEMQPAAALRYETFLEHLDEQQKDGDDELFDVSDVEEGSEEETELLQALAEYKHKIVH